MTSTDRLLGLIQDTPGIADLLRSSFEFDITRKEPGEAVLLASGVSLEGIAGDWSGGTFFLCRDDGGRRPVVFASSEGQAGLIADDLTAALEIIIGVAWRDCLTFSGGGSVQAMQASAAHRENALANVGPEIAEHRARVAAALSLCLAPVTELVARLQEAVSRTEPNYVVVTESGDAYESLFGTFLAPRGGGWL